MAKSITLKIIFSFSGSHKEVKIVTWININSFIQDTIYSIFVELIEDKFISKY